MSDKCKAQINIEGGHTEDCDADILPGCVSCIKHEYPWVVEEKFLEFHTKVQHLEHMVGAALEHIETHAPPQVYKEYREFCIKLSLGDFDEGIKNNET